MNETYIHVQAEPCPQPRPKFNGHHAYTPDKTGKLKAWKEAIQWAIRPFVKPQPCTNPVEIEISLYLQRPKSHYKANGEVKPAYAGTWHTSKRGDIDNYIKSTMDALTDAGIWHDDSQVVSLTACKRWGSKGGAFIKIREIKDGPTTH